MAACKEDLMTYDEGWDRIHGTQDDERRCQKCGCPTKGEEAWVGGQIWCHPCADEAPEALRPVIRTGRLEART